MRSLSCLMFLSVGLTFSCGSADTHTGFTDYGGWAAASGVGGRAAGSGGSAVSKATGGASATGGSTNAGASGNGSSGANGGSTVVGNVDCMAVPRTGNICGRDGICIADSSCLCIEGKVQCGNQGTGGASLGSGGTRSSTGGAVTTGGTKPTNVYCGADPRESVSCTGGPGDCPTDAGCYCSTGGTIVCGSPGSGGASASSGGSGNGGAGSASTGGRQSSSGGSASGGRASASGGREGTGRGGAGSAGSNGGSTAVCPATPTVDDPCKGGDGVCPQDPECFCISLKIVGTNCRTR